ncbi:N-acetylmuramidase [Flavivirga aquatica]|uniref:Peptidoglycan hydrolase n=1 Tax=Flavivirga aquatica TaxID=1849968 RepID=A0A1E5TCA2_9FLAO|nr:glucosaminidase domain-containing protein [Flavivirga aquatica]OEK09023.1 N-acetylmuramidase [Flavivirga aquatica]
MKRLVLLVLCFGCLFFSCRSKKVVVTKRPNRTTKKVVIKKQEQPKVNVKETSASNKIYANSTERYIDTYKDIAQQEMNLYGIPASITLAQGILESGSGKGALSRNANNHFGIKCHDWTGARVYHDDDAKQECFRKYKDAKYSFRDHSLFLKERKRYAKLFKLKKSDYKGWAIELRAAGYATDRKYPAKLITLIERYQLYKLDGTKKGNRIKPKVKEAVVKEVSKGEVHVVTKGDTLYSISKMYNMRVEDLQKINDIKGTDIKIGQKLELSLK